MAYTMVDLSDLEGSGPGGMVRMLRKALDARAFGFNYFTLPPGADGREHDHLDNGQEEVYFVVQGSGTMRIDEEEVPLRAGRFLRVDAASTRRPTAGPDGLEFLTIGAPLEGTPYRPPPWG
jgi:mannose-6-phosphate isomerase-like protein (cupin superfamily)